MGVDAMTQGAREVSDCGVLLRCGEVPRGWRSGQLGNSLRPLLTPGSA